MSLSIGSLHFEDVLSPDEWRREFSDSEQAILASINQKVAAADTLDEVMGFLFESTAAVYPCDRLGLSFLEDGNRRVVSHWFRAQYEPVLLGKGYAEELQGSSLETVLQSGRPRIIDDLEQYLEAHPGSRSTRLVLREGVRSSMTCPLIVSGRPVGFLFRSSRRPYVYDRHQALFHQALAERLSQAVEKAYRIGQLTEANRAYAEMLGFVSHELKSPLASLVMDAETLLGGYLGALEAPQQKKIERMVSKAHYLLGLIGDYLNLARIESGDFAPMFREGVDFLGEVVEPALDVVQNLMDEHRVVFEPRFPPEPVRVTCDPGLMTIALVNLLGNAVKYGETPGEIQLTVETPAGQGLRVAVWNRGPGFPPEERARLFRKFSRLQTPELLKRRGTGVGLYTVWRVVLMHGGRIWAESEPGQWARFTFRIPQPLPQELMQHRTGREIAK